MRIKLKDESIRYKNFRLTVAAFIIFLSSKGLKLVCKNFYLNNRGKLNKPEIIKKFIEFSVTKQQVLISIHDDVENFMVYSLGRPYMEVLSSVRKKVLKSENLLPCFHK